MARARARAAPLRAWLSLRGDTGMLLRHGVLVSGDKISLWRSMAACRRWTIGRCGVVAGDGEKR